MTRAIEPDRIRRRNILLFIGLILRPLMRLFTLSVCSPKNTEKASRQFSEIYSRLWDFADHSISNQGFDLPCSLGEGPVNRVNKLLAKLYGGTFASLSFGGSSGALLTLLTAVMPRLSSDRDLILFDGVCHQSTIGGLIFGRWKAIRLPRDQQVNHQTVCPVTLESVKNIIERHGPDRFAAIILVLPSYDGFRSPSEDMRIYDYAKSRGIFVIVDGAWDALRFRRPTSNTPPLSSICDVWITSPHKRGLTPSSLGCILTDNEKIARLWDEALDLGFRSSSVSFVNIMIAEHRLEQIVSGEWDMVFDQAERAAISISNRIHEVHTDLNVVRPADVQAEMNDPAHILISTYEIEGLNARRWAAILSDEFGLDVEKATSSTLLLLCGSPAHLAQIDEIIFYLREALKMTLAQNQGE